ncbi:Flp family type IVb pilin [Sphingomonas sp. IW22]|jgi:pilus assembly protein Flp/PilA|uniref:Flp family type IVb pilin n=1 Tax=Sphingomonas sp. IW22 TaxID=3242489 RepID=UPI0035217CA3
MARWTGLAQRILADRRGVTVVEYALIVALIVLAIVATVTDVAGATIALWNTVDVRVDDVM